VGEATRGAVFLDRDGTVIADRHYLRREEEVVLLPGAAAAVARLNRAGVPVLLVTNQSGIGRGLLTEEHFRAVQRRLVELLRREGAHLDGVYHCPHAPDEGCACRKPAPGLFQRAAREHGVDPRRSAFVGDRLRDVEPGIRLGGRSLLIVAESTPVAEREGMEGVEVVDTLPEAVDRLLRRAGDD
jgi:D-glycero-D-manno-heptose 1,7-bisphosphate phosphatase